MDDEKNLGGLEDQGEATTLSKAIGWSLFLLPMFFVWCLIGVWPTQIQEGTNPANVVGYWEWLNPVTAEVAKDGRPAVSPRHGISAEVRLMLVVLISGALGSAIHAGKSFATFRGLRKYDESWNWWYLLRFPTGMGLALLFYLVMRAGLFNGSIDDTKLAESVNPFGFAALGALAGMFARQASDKLEEIFERVFAVVADSPVVAKPVVNPGLSVKVAVPPVDVNLKVPGKNFVKGGTTATVDGEDRDVTDVTSTSLMLKLPTKDLTKPGPLKLRVATKQGGQSDEAAIALLP